MAAMAPLGEGWLMSLCRTGRAAEGLEGVGGINEYFGAARQL